MNKASNYAFYQVCQLKGVKLDDPLLSKTEASALRITFNLDISKARVMKKMARLQMVQRT